MTIQGDNPEFEEVKPTVAFEKDQILAELAGINEEGGGEVQVYLAGSNPASDPPDYEVHGYDTHVMQSAQGDRVVIYTQTDDEDDAWFFADDIIALERH